jgi:hypothetical protein
VSGIADDTDVFQRAFGVLSGHISAPGDETVGPGSDITSKRAFFVSLFESNGELKRFLRCNAGGI